MRRIPAIAFLVACVVGAAQAQVYHACLEYNSNYYDLMSDPSGTTLDRYNGATFVNRQTYAAFHLPAAGTIVWDEGVAFAATMQTRNAWLNNEQTSKATWIHNGANDAFMWYTTVGGVPNQFEFTTAKCRPATTAAPPAPNCMSALNAFGVFCNSNEDCCGYGSMSPRCIVKNSGNSCCTHFLAATTCNSSQTCCGSQGTGASSFAFCCNAGSSCCRAQASNAVANCCPTGTTCCQAPSIGLCCAADEVCEPNLSRCSKVSTPAPTPVPNGGHRGCISYNGWFYDLRSDAAGTTLDRYQGTTFVNRQTYAAFHPPAAGTIVWDEGVAFAATMQTRNAWLNNEQTSAATWFQAPGTGYDRFTWSTTVGGAPMQFAFTTEACSGAPVPPTPAPTPAPTAAPTPAPGGAHRGCTSNNGWFYDLRSDAAGTTLDRYQGTTFVNRQTYAAFHPPAAGTIVWDEGVAFAATMQTRNAWLNNEQTSAATWFHDPANGNDRFTWSTTVNGVPTQYTFVTQACP